MNKIKLSCSKCGGLVGFLEYIDGFDLTKTGIDKAICKECDHKQRLRGLKK